MRTAKPFKPGDTCKRGHLWTTKTLRVRFYTRKYHGKVYACTMRECRACANLLKVDRRKRNPKPPKPRRPKPSLPSKSKPPKRTWRVNPPRPFKRAYGVPKGMYGRLFECWIEDLRELHSRP